MEYHKHISNLPITWFDYLLNPKTYEGRIPDPEKDWSKIQVGDKIRFYTTDRPDLWVKVVDLQYFSDFDEAYEKLGVTLIPNKPEDMSANDVYTKLVGFRMEDIKKYGVVAVGIERN